MTEISRIQELWSSHDQNLQKQMSINIDLLRKINLDKIERKIKNLVWKKAIALSCYVIVVLLLVFYVISNLPNPNLAISGGLISIWAFAFCLTSMRELRMALSINYTDPTSVLQQHLLKYRSAVIKYLRIGVWILPLHLAFVVLFFDLLFGIDIIQTGNQNWLISQFLFSIFIMIPLAIWMHRKLSITNADKKWMHQILRGNGSQITDSLQLLEEIDELENAE